MTERKMKHARACSWKEWRGRLPLQDGGAPMNRGRSKRSFSCREEGIPWVTEGGGGGIRDS